MNEEDAVLILRNLGDKFSSEFFMLGIFGGGVSRYAATPLIIALSPGHSDITRHRPWSPIAPDRKSFRPLTSLIRVQAFRDPLQGELPHIHIFMNDGPNPLT